MAEQGLVASIFGKTVYELQQERVAQRKKQMAAFAKAAQSRGESSGIASGGFLLGSALADKMFPNTEAMEKAKQAEEKQTALNKQLASIDRPDDPRRFMILADAAKSVGNMDAYIDYIGMAADAENLAERRRKQYRDQEMKEADELSEQLDLRDKGIALSTIFDKDTPEEERNKALQNFYQVGGTANDLYAYKQIGESLSKGGITKRQAGITDKFVSDLSNGVVSPAEVYRNYKSIYGDDFTVPESFLDQFETDKENPGDGTGGNDGNGGNPQAGGTGKELGIDTGLKLNFPDYWEWYSKQKEQEEPEEPVDPNKLGIRQLKLPNLNFTTYEDLYETPDRR